ncbi:MAG TPA: hypothetical protein VK272_12235 [Solirubrobacteraceae bacterium]|nr:hypothetical protein [Solirubrobacteraceae bacterium]
MASPALSNGGHGDPAIWALLPGETIEREMLQERYGGRTNGRIAPSTCSPNVLLFSDPPAGEPLGQFDGWRADGCFHYTGEGRRGDQRMKAGNAAILEHAGAGRALRLLMGTRGRVAYEGEFELAADRPFYITDAPEADNGSIRSVIVFRLSPLDVRPKPSASLLDRVNRAGVEDVPIEEQWTEKAFVAPSQAADEAERREWALVLAFRDHLLGQGHEVGRLKIVPPGEAKPLFADLIDRTTNTLFEAKGTVERGSIRMAVGQLLDYSRFIVPTPRMAVLLPAQPRADLLGLLSSARVGVVWREGKKFVESDG